MKTLTITAAIVSALAIGAVATLSSRSASPGVARAEYSQTAMPIDQLTLNARDHLPAQSFDAF